MGENGKQEAKAGCVLYPSAGIQRLRWGVVSEFRWLETLTQGFGMSKSGVADLAPKLRRVQPCIMKEKASSYEQVEQTTMNVETPYLRPQGDCS